MHFLIIFDIAHSCQVRLLKRACHTTDWGAGTQWLWLDCWSSFQCCFKSKMYLLRTLLSSILEMMCKMSRWSMLGLCNVVLAGLEGGHTRHWCAYLCEGAALRVLGNGIGLKKSAQKKPDSRSRVWWFYQWWHVHTCAAGVPFSAVAAGKYERRGILSSLLGEWLLLFSIAPIFLTPPFLQLLVSSFIHTNKKKSLQGEGAHTFGDYHTVSTCMAVSRE